MILKVLQVIILFGIFYQHINAADNIVTSADDPTDSTAKVDLKDQDVSSKQTAKNLQITNPNYLATPGQFPFMVYLEMKYIANNFTARRCGGSLIKDNMVVTAASCLYCLYGITVTATVGEVNLGAISTPANVIPACYWMIHPGFNYVGGPSHPINDVAVVRLTNSVTIGPNINVIPLDVSFGPKPCTSLVVSGFGGTTYNGFSPLLTYKKVQMVPSVICQTYWPSMANYYNILCGISGMIPLQSICNLDYGGPLFGDKLVGIISFGYSKCSSNYGDGYTKVSPYVSWISSAVQALNVMPCT